MFTSTVTSSICEWPVESQRIKLLDPAAFPSTTTWVGEVARVSITVGLLDRMRVTGDWRLITTDFPTKTCKACPSDCATVGIADISTIPRANIRRLYCPNAKVLIFLRYRILASQNFWTERCVPCITSIR